jgi:hypothetical protein
MIRRAGGRSSHRRPARIPAAVVSDRLARRSLFGIGACVSRNERSLANLSFPHCSLPVDFGGGFENHGSFRRKSTTAFLDFPEALVSPFLSYLCAPRVI